MTDNCPRLSKWIKKSVPNQPQLETSLFHHVISKNSINNMSYYRKHIKKSQEKITLFLTFFHLFNHTG